MPEFEIIEKEIGSVIGIERTISMLKMASTMGKDFTELMELVSGLETENESIPFSRYYDVDWESQMNNGFLKNLIEIFTKKWHFSCCVPVRENMEGIEKYNKETIERGKYLKTMHYGAYHKVADTYKKMYNYAKSNNLNLVGESYEFYLNSPKEVSSKELQTEILIPILN